MWLKTDVGWPRVILVPRVTCNPYQALMGTYNPGGAEALKFVALRTPYLVESHAKLIYSKPSRAPTLQAA